MIISDEVPGGSLCASDQVSRLIEDLQYTLGEGPCLDACRQGRVAEESDLANPETPRWPAFSPPALEAGARAVFGIPLRVGGVGLGALDLYRDRPGTLSEDQRADALVMAEVVTSWVLGAQAGASAAELARQLETEADFHFIVHNTAGMLSVQMAISVSEALIRLRSYAFSHDRPLPEVAEDVVAGRLRLR